MQEKILKTTKTVVIYFGIITMVLALVFSTITSIRFYKNDSEELQYHVYEEMAVLEYNAAKLELVNAIDAYIQSVAKGSSLDGIVVLDNCLKYDIDICFVLAQGDVESKFGTAGIARKTNSVWNVFAGDSFGYADIHHKGKYKSPNDSVKPYMELLSTKYLSDKKTEYDLMKNFVDKGGHRYASSSTYEESLLAKYNEIRTSTNIEQLALDLKKHAIVLGY